MRRHALHVALLYSAVGLILTACNPNKPLPDEELAPDSSLVDLMVDLRLLEARAELTHLPDTTHDSLRALVFERQNETEASLAHRIDEATDHPQKLERLLEEVQTALSLERQGNVWGVDTTDHGQRTTNE